jgi:hypothetical protein
VTALSALSVHQPGHRGGDRRAAGVCRSTYGSVHDFEGWMCAKQCAIVGCSWLGWSTPCGLAAHDRQFPAICLWCAPVQSGDACTCFNRPRLSCVCDGAQIGGWSFANGVAAGSPTASYKVPAGPPTNSSPPLPTDNWTHLLNQARAHGVWDAPWHETYPTTTRLALRKSSQQLAVECPNVECPNSWM